MTVDDGSLDNTSQMVEALADPASVASAMKRIRMAPRQGIGQKGISKRFHHMAGERISSDDKLSPARKSLHTMESPGEVSIKTTTRPMKVLIVSQSSGMAGTERSLLLLLRHIDRAVFVPVVALATSGPLREELERLGVSTHVIGSPWWVREKLGFVRLAYCLSKETVALLKLYRLIKRARPDIVYTNNVVIFTGAISAFVMRKPHVWHIRDLIPGNAGLKFFFSRKILFRIVSKLSWRIVANSNATARQFHGFKPNREVEVVYNAVDFEDFGVVAPLPDIDGVTSKDWLVAVVGSLRRGKGQDDAIRALQIAEKSIPNIKLLLIGRSDRKFKEYLKQLASKMGVSSKVVFAGYRDDVPRILPHCKALLMLAQDEGFGRVTIEAMASGVAVVGMDSGGTREIVQDGVTGYLVPPGDPLEAAGKLIELYKHPDVAKRLGNNGKRVVRERFAPEVYTQRIEEIILNVVQEQQS